MDSTPRTTQALPGKEAGALARALDAGDVTVFVDGTALRLPPAARDAVLDLLARLARGAAVTVADARADGDPATAGGRAAAPAGTQAAAAPSPLLTTSQAAAAAGISHTYLRNLTDAGIIPVEYRGSHRRIRMEDIQAWLEQQRLAKEARRTSGRAATGAE
ncbi:Helix-turn-helix domain protein [Arthrobacter saudimassiliensis]|uniref:Helix-turn-helix domain protein n=1 Tax=Arthrobacter saudimassiliensis TaxID=1461584 RepID=A0A078MVN0_9MICC|nr:Helix-turn-helix domain protein [Arthrobacter saudimassiliensis]